MKYFPVVLTISVTYKLPNIICSCSGFIIWIGEIVINVEHAFQMRLFYLIALFLSHMAKKEEEYHEYLQMVVRDAAKCFSLSFLEKLTEPLILIFTSSLPLLSVSCETFCHFNLLIRFSVCTSPLPSQSFCLIFAPLTSFFSSYEGPIDRSISSIECRVTCIDGFWWDCSERKGRGWSCVFGGVLCTAGTYEKGDRWKLRSAVNRWRNREPEILEPIAVLSDVFQK